MRPGNHSWTEDEVNLLFYLREDRHFDWEKIGERLGILPYRCSVKFHSENQYRRVARGERAERHTCPNAVMIDREKRQAARLRQSFTGLTFGDPLPGYSALDKRRTGA